MGRNAHNISVAKYNKHHVFPFFLIVDFVYEFWSEQRACAAQVKADLFFSVSPGYFSPRQGSCRALNF